MKSILHRAYDVPELELRGGDGRTLSGLAAPFNKPAEMFEGGVRFAESIRPGAFAKTIRERTRMVGLFAQHETKRLPLGAIQTLRETSDGLSIEARISDTPDGNAVLELIRDGALTGLSIGFQPIREEWSRDGSRRELQEIKLHEISVVHAPAYPEAVIAGVRSELVPSGPSLDLYLRRLQLAQLQGTR